MAGIFGFTGLLETAAPIAQVIFYFLLAFSLLSLILSLFEETNGVQAPRMGAGCENPATAAAYQLVFDFAPSIGQQSRAAIDKA